jgi:HlyD family secretion protein
MAQVKKLVILGLAAAGGLGWWLWPAKAAPPPVGGHAAVKRGDFPIVIVEQGSFAARQSMELRIAPEAFHNPLTITKVVSAGTAVRKGDVVLECDKAEITRIIAQAEVELQAGKNDVVQATEDLNIILLQNRIDMERAAYDSEAADANLRKWEELQAPKEMKEAEARIVEASNALDEAATNHRVLVEMRKKELVSEAELRRAELAMNKAQTDLELGTLAQRLLRGYTHPLETKRVRNEVRDRKSWLEGKKGATNALAAQKRSALLRAESALKEKEDRLLKLRRDHEALTLKAPVDGIVLHGDLDNRWWRQEDKLLVGEKAQPHQTLMTVPDLSAFKVKVGVSEADVNKVKPGMKAVIRPEALPDLSMKAAVRVVSTVVTRGGFWDPDGGRSKFDVELDLEGVDSRLKPGMKCKVEISVEEVKDALHVPLDAVFEKEGKVVCHVLGTGAPQERTVKTGRSSADYVEILDGLKESEKVALYDPLKK